MASIAPLSVANFADVTVDISPTAIPLSPFGIPLILGDSDVIDTVNRLRSYDGIESVGADFASDTPEFQAATVFYEQEPQPLSCIIGRWASTATNGELLGAILTPTEQQISNFTPITSGSFFVVIDGVPHAITGIALNAQTNLNGVAAQIQAELPAGVTCVWNAAQEYFEVVSSTTGSSSSVGYLGSPTAVGNFAFASTGPVTTNTITINTVSIEFITSGASGNEVNIGGSPTAATTLAALLTFLQSSTNPLLTALAYATDATHLYIYDLTPGAGGDAITISVGTAPNVTASGATLTGATGTDISSLVGGTTAMGAVAVPGLAAETPLAAVEACAGVSNSWYGLSIPQNTAVALSLSDYSAISAYILASTRLRLFGISIYGNGTGAAGGTACLNPAITNDLASVIQSFNNKRVYVHYSSANPASALTAFGRAFTTNWEASNTAYTLAYKQAPGIPGENLQQNQFNTLISKGGNAVVNVSNGATMIWDGQMANGLFFDEVHGLDWFANRCQTDAFNALYQSLTKIPQTDAGDNQIAGILAGSCNAAVNNGLVAPGQWNSIAITVGSTTLEAGAMLTAGFLVMYPPIASQDEAVRETRVSVPFTIALKLAGAVQQVDVAVLVNR